MDTLELACAVDRGYLAHTAAMIHSVARQRGTLGLRVHVLHGERLPRRAVRRLQAMIDGLGGSVVFHRVAAQRVEGLATFPEITVTMWYRIYLPELLPASNRVLYLDGDVIAMDSLEPLWATDLGDHLVAAVTNVFMQGAEHRSRPAALGLPGLDAYFNTGVLLLNLEAMRSHGSTDKIRAFARDHEVVFPDQDAFNAVMSARRLALHPRWNCMNSTMTFPWAAEVFGEAAVREARAAPGLRHFEGPGPNKPWNRDCTFPMRERYFEHLQQTPWRRRRLRP